MGGARELSIEDLAAESGLSVRTLRYYQGEDLLPPPVRRGREVRYDREHLERLRLIGELQDRGLRLSAIREVLRLSHEPQSVERWLGINASLSTPWTADRAALWTTEELNERVGGSIPVDALAEHGIVERRTDTVPVTYLVRSPRLLEVLVQLVSLGVSLDAAVAAHAMLRSRLDRLAGDLVAVVGEDPAIAERVRSGDIGELVDAIRPLAATAVNVAFAHAMERALGEIAELVAALRAAEVPPVPHHQGEETT